MIGQGKARTLGPEWGLARSVFGGRKLVGLLGRRTSGLVGGSGKVDGPGDEEHRVVRGKLGRYQARQNIRDRNRWVRVPRKPEQGQVRSDVGGLGIKWSGWNHLQHLLSGLRL